MLLAVKGRLFSELRDKQSLAYALSFMAQPNLDPGFIGVYMGTHPNKLETAIEAVLTELKKVERGRLDRRGGGKSEEIPHW